MTLMRAGDPSARLCLLCRIMAEKWTRSLRFKQLLCRAVYLTPSQRWSRCCWLGWCWSQGRPWCSSACRACLRCAPPRSPPIYLPFEINININHPDLDLSLLLYPHHVRLDQQFVNRPISCQWVIGDLQEKVLSKLVEQIRNHLHANPENCSTRHNLLFVIP